MKFDKIPPGYTREKIIKIGLWTNHFFMFFCCGSTSKVKPGVKGKKSRESAYLEKEETKSPEKGRSAEKEIFGPESKEKAEEESPTKNYGSKDSSKLRIDTPGGTCSIEIPREVQAIGYAKEFGKIPANHPERFLLFLKMIHKVNSLETSETMQCLIPSSWYYDEFVSKHKIRKVASSFSNLELLEKLVNGTLKKEDYEVVGKNVYLFLESVCGGGPIIELPPENTTFDFLTKQFRENLIKSVGLSDSKLDFNLFLEKYREFLDKDETCRASKLDLKLSRQVSSTSTIASIEVGPNLPIIGIKNYSIHCFLNSVLQALISTPDFISNALAVHNTSYTTKNSNKNSFVLEFSNFTKDYLLTKKKSGDNQAVLKMLPKYMRTGQQDAQECLTAILSGLQEELNARENTQKKPVEFNKAQEADEYFSKHYSSFVDRLFMGRFTATVTCNSCKKISENFDPFYDLSLSIKYDNTKKMIQDYFTKEKVKYKCEACKKSTTATKTLKIARLPKILVLHIKRFVYKPEMQKIDNEIEFSRTIDLRPYFFYFFS